nr:hypothetical protein [Tanacetum cinerariifolium]
MENEHELSYEILTRVYLRSYEHYKSVGAEDKNKHGGCGGVFVVLRIIWSKRERCGHFKDQEMDCGTYKQLVGEGGESLRKVDSSKALNAGLIVTKSNETELERYVSSSRSRNDTHTNDAYIIQEKDKKPMAVVQLSIEHNILANEKQHSKQSKSIYDTYLLEKVDRNTTPDSAYMSHMGGEIDQNAKKLLEKPHHKIAPSSIKNSSKESHGSNDMTHKYYLVEAKKKTQERDRKSITSVTPFANSQNTTKSCKSKPKGNNQTSRVLPTSKSSCPTTIAMPNADHSRKSSPFSDFTHFVCSTCQKCVFSVNHDVCITKFLKEVNSHVKIQSSKTRDSAKAFKPMSHTQKPSRKIVTVHRFSPNKSSDVHEKTNTPRSCLWWIPTSRIFNTIGLSSGLSLYEMTPTTISSGLMSNPLPSTPFVPPSRTDWDLLFKPLFDELLTPPPSVDHPTPEVIAPIAEVVAPEPVA